MAALTRDQILDQLWPTERSSVYAVLDGARDERIYGAVNGSHLLLECLYSGDLPWQLQMTAPYIVQLEKDDRLTQQILDQGWGKSWGIFFRSNAGFKELRKHLRRFLRVRDESGRRLIFRFYDPRVLRVYLPSCSAVEAATFFGRIDGFVMEAEDGSVLEFPQPKGVVPSKEALAPLWTLTVRREQLSLLNRDVLRQYKLRVARLFESRYPGRFESPEGAEEFVEASVKIAARYQVTSELHIAMLADFLLHHGTDFASDPRCEWAKAILEDTEGTGNDRVARLDSWRTLMAPSATVAT